MKLYFFPLSPNTRKVLFVAHHLGIPLETEFVDLGKGEQRKPEYLRLNPNGKTPTLQDGDFVLWESNAIMQYLASTKPNELWPEDARTRADIARWQFWSAAHWGPAAATLIWENMVKSFLGLGAPDALEVKKGEEGIHAFGSVLNQHLEGREWLVGGKLTLADISVAAYLMAAKPARMPIEPYRRVQDWYARIEALEAWKKSAPQMG